MSYAKIQDDPSYLFTIRFKLSSGWVTIRAWEARAFWKSLSTHDRWELGDQLVLGSFDWRDWMDRKPSAAFLNELDAERMYWEVAS